MESFSTIRSAKDLIAFIAPRLDEIHRDANLQGTVLKRIDPLLEALPNNVVISALGTERLGLDAHETAYLQFAMWLRAAPGHLRHGLNRHDTFGDVLNEAARRASLSSNTVFAPFWLSSGRDVLGLDGATTSPTVVVTYQDGGAQSFALHDLHDLSKPRLVVNPAQIDVIAKHPDPDTRELQFLFRPGPSNAWGFLSDARDASSLLPLSKVPPHLLENLARLLRSFTASGASGLIKHIRRATAADDPEMVAVGKLLQAIDQALAINAPSIEQGLRVLEAFQRGELGSLVGQTSTATVNAVAALTRGPTADGAPR
jgi:hypothetical protein